jgi:hypothetical protein
LLDEDKLTGLKLINFSGLQGIISQLLDFEAVAKENEAKIMELYETKAVKFCLDNTQMLKYQVLAKVSKMRMELDKANAAMISVSLRQRQDGREVEKEVQRRRRACGEIGGCIWSCARQSWPTVQFVKNLYQNMGTFCL